MRLRQSNSKTFSSVHVIILSTRLIIYWQRHLNECQLACRKQGPVKKTTHFRANKGVTS